MERLEYKKIWNKVHADTYAGYFRSLETPKYLKMHWNFGKW